MVGNTDLLLDDVDAADLFRDRMLDLDARVHFHEVAAAIGRQQKLDACLQTYSRHAAPRRISVGRTCAVPHIVTAAHGTGVSPRSSSDCGAGSCSPAHRDARQLPYSSASTWTSTCLGCSMYFLHIDIFIVRSRPWPRSLALWYACSSSSALRTMRMPLPPPPLAALMMSG